MCLYPFHKVPVLSVLLPATFAMIFLDEKNFPVSRIFPSSCPFRGFVSRVHVFAFPVLSNCTCPFSLDQEKEITY